MSSRALRELGLGAGGVCLAESGGSHGGVLINSQVHYCYASHLAVDDDDGQVFASLLRAVYNETIQRNFNYFLIGLSESSPLRPVVTKNYLHITYAIQLYLVAWEDGLEAVAQVDGRVPAPEIAVL